MQVSVPIEEGAELQGELSVPPEARGVVLFAHGSGSSRLSPRNQFVARTLQGAGLATLLIDLLTGEEEHRERHTRHLRFDIELLAKRLEAASLWLRDRPETADLAVGYFGASTGAAAALVAASRMRGVSAIVSRGGRPDLAGAALRLVNAPTLLIVGGEDQGVLELNRYALDELSSVKRLEVVPGASHTFEEAGTLGQAAGLASAWFRYFLAREQAIPRHP